MFTSAMSASSSATSQPSRLRPIGGRKTADAATCTRYIQRNKHTVAAGSSPLFACAETRAKCSITSALAKYISVTHSKAIHPHASNRLFYIGNIGSPGRNRTCIYRLGAGCRRIYNYIFKRYTLTYLKKKFLYIGINLPLLLFNLYNQSWVMAH